MEQQSDDLNTKVYDIYSKSKPIHKEENLTIVRYDLITKKMLDTMDKRNALVIVSVSPMEVHGSFLPLGSDFIEALMMNELIKEILKERKKDKQFTIIEIPPLPIGTGTLRGVKGTIHFSHSTFRNTVKEYLDGIVNAGFTKIMITSVHHGLIHALALEEAAMKVMKKHAKSGVRIVSPLNWIVKKIYVDNPKKTWKSVVEEIGQTPLSEDEYTALFQDHHSSIMEIAFVKNINPKLVDPEYKNCEPHVEGNVHGIKSLISKKWSNLGGPKAYSYNGHPAKADSRNWFVLYEKLIKDVGEEFIDALFVKDNEEFEKYTKSFMWPIFFLKTNYKWRFLATLIICLAVLFYLPLFPLTLIPIIIFVIYLVIRLGIVVKKLKQD